MNESPGAVTELLAGLRAALQAAIVAPATALDEMAQGADEEEAPVSPRTAAANALADLALQARDAYWEEDDEQGEAACALLSNICFYVVDPLLRPEMLDLAAQCVAALEAAHRDGGRAPGLVDALRGRFEALRPSDDDAAAIARALGMSEEEATAFGLTGHITTVGLDDDEVEPELVYASSGDAAEAGDATPVEQESLEVLFRRDAQALVATAMPRALQRYWQNQASMDALLEVRRAYHTLKGDAAVAAQDSGAPDLPGLSLLAEAAEDIIDELLGDERDSEAPAPALPAGAFGLLGEAQAFLLKRLAARDALPGEEALLKRLYTMQAKARTLQNGGSDLAPAREQSESVSAPRTEVARPDEHTVNARLVLTFLSEAAKLMPDLHRALARLSQEPGDENALVRARVKLHTLKGGAALAGPDAAAIERLAHNCEDILETIEDYQLSGSLTTVPAAVLNGVLDTEDALQALLDGLRHSAGSRQNAPGASPTAPPAPDVEALVERLQTVKAQVERGELDEAASPAASHHSGVSIERATGKAMESVARDVTALTPHTRPQSPSAAMRRQSQANQSRATHTEQAISGGIPPLAALPDIELGMPIPRPVLPARETGAVDRPRPITPTAESAKEDGLRRAMRALEDQQVSRDALDLLLRGMGTQSIESRRANARLRDLVERVAQELAGLRHELVRTTRRSGEWDALEKEEYTAIDVLLMQLDEALADQQEAETHLRRDLAEARAQNELLAEALLRAQRGLLDMSMVPLSSLEARLDHAVRSVARRLNKSVVFELDGGDVALDSRIAEALFNPLMLLINNALDHGLEEKEAERSAAGKSPEGHIVVRGRTNGDSVTITLGDDGRGIDPDRVVAVAVTKGVIEASRAVLLTREERLALIWQPGFSTAKQVGAISGRGMGMKSVQDEVAALQGRVTVETEPGRGTTFTITLPRSLALMRVQVIREGTNLAAVPISEVAATHSMAYDAVVEVPGGRVVRLGDRTLAIYGAHLSTGPAGDGPNGRGILLEVNGRPGGILVDEVLYSQYLPVRPAPAFLRRAGGLIGYALGDGGVIMPILDLETLVEKAVTTPALVVRAAGGIESPVSRHSILVVDDSQTMRRALAQTFGRAGFIVREAANGREALAAIGRERPDVITLDMEMPGMDGLETLAALRLLPGGASVPVFMVTSRQQARHRAAALGAGVTRYFTKPYDDDELVGAARLALAGGLTATEAAS